ncbi:Helix-turn-helix domain-containing protein [Mycolicibacterium rutilum]|uniref:Helix-turn-helix domain-containing protein n=1 Tax=Mycolicibacterium rutilum TaxID=370526 RepID=A0A1H6IRI0_MYCRU|nr:helix-turn-helix transcriptional regulator [Mycolicibacterium rutilum]SEH50593.1 Helix-turn-helix domain-containing protein [Mycolicibacterium rutilum]
MSTSPLAQFLRHQRARRRPEEIGLLGAGQRRVPGLRREEVAARANISVEYYSRLEQGRVRTPSPAVCEALARALGLDELETCHLLDLANPRRSRPGEGSPCVPDGSRLLIDTLSVPAIIQNRYTDVLAANRLAGKLSPNLRVGENRIRAIFTHPYDRAMFVDWDRATANCVAQLRLSIGGDVTAERPAQLIRELMDSSEKFRQLWSRAEVEPAPMSPIRLRHPEIGLLELFAEKLHIAGAHGLALVIYHARPGTSSCSALQRLSAAQGSPPRRVVA